MAWEKQAHEARGMVHRNLVPGVLKVILYNRI